MKTKVFSIVALVAMLSAPSAFAVGSGATYSRLVLSGSVSVLSTAYTELVHSTVKGLKALSVMNTASHPVVIAFGASGSEVQQVVAPATSAAVQAVPMPVTAGYGTRVSVESLDGTNSSGELEFNFFYN